MTKAELVKFVAGKTNVAQIGAVDTVDAVIEGISTALASGDNVMLKGFGAFKVKETKARTGRNPKTGEMVQIPAGKKVSFTVSKELKARIAG